MKYVKWLASVSGTLTNVCRVNRMCRLLEDFIAPDCLLISWTFFVVWASTSGLCDFMSSGKILLAAWEPALPKGPINTDLRPATDST